MKWFISPLKVHPALRLVCSLECSAVQFMIANEPFVTLENSQFGGFIDEKLRHKVKL